MGRPKSEDPLYPTYVGLPRWVKDTYDRAARVLGFERSAMMRAALMEGARKLDKKVKDKVVRHG